MFKINQRYTERFFSDISNGYCSLIEFNDGCTDIYPVSQMSLKKIRKKYICGQKLDLDYDNFIVSTDEKVLFTSALKTLENVGKIQLKLSVWTQNMIVL